MAFGLIGVIAAAALVTRSAYAVRRDPGLSVLLITIDTLRADALGAYGRRAASTPWIDRLAREGVLFERVYAHNVVTFPSHTNILSGRLPLEHGVRDNSGFRFPAAEASLATLLGRAGLRTAAFVSAFVLDSRLGLDRGFEVYDDHLGGTETGVARAFSVPERKGQETVAAASSWLDGIRGSRFFAFLHVYEPHFPYEPPPAFLGRFRNDPYHGEVAAADAALEAILRPILERGAEARTLIILTSDHGESLGEHEELTHGIFAYESTLRVPLILWAPGRLPAGRRIETPVRHVDLVPTVLDMLERPLPQNLAGRSLLGLVAGRGEAPGPVYFEALSSSLNQGWAPLRGVLKDGLKYVDLPLPELYDLRKDPAEAKNLVATRPEELASLRGLLQRFRARDQGTARKEEDAAALEKLRALGYVSAGASAEKERYAEADDPKRLIDLDTRTRRVNLLFRDGRLDEAVALCRANLQLRPDMPLAHLHLAYLERARGNLRAAVAAARRAFELKPMDGEAAYLYATYLNEAGRPRDTLAFLEPLLERVQPDVDLLTARAMALQALGRAPEALEALARAREVDPSNPMVLVNAGTIFLKTGDPVRARQAFEAALEIDGKLAKAHNSLGVMAAMEKRPEEAIARWKRAIELDPADYQTLFNLGFTLRRQGRSAEAHPYFEAYLRSAPRALEGRDIARVEAWLRQAGS